MRQSKSLENPNRQTIPNDPESIRVLNEVAAFSRRARILLYESLAQIRAHEHEPHRAEPLGS